MLPFAVRKMFFYGYKKGMTKMFGCIFCQVAAREKSARIIYEDDQCVAFEDIHPQAPVHVLVVPRRHIASLNDGQAGDEPVLGRLLNVAARVAKAKGIDGTGFRTVINTNAEAGQTVFHVHVHVLGGKVMGWPPWPAKD
jgi:histidine triad (HIT) family protein